MTFNVDLVKDTGYERYHVIYIVNASSSNEALNVVTTEFEKHAKGETMMMGTPKVTELPSTGIVYQHSKDGLIL